MAHHHRLRGKAAGLLGGEATGPLWRHRDRDRGEGPCGRRRGGRGRERGNTLVGRNIQRKDTGKIGSWRVGCDAREDSQVLSESDEERSQSSQPSTSSSSAVECYGVGMDVQCEVDPELVEVEKELEAKERNLAPVQEAALAGGILGLLSLTSPFFFWGTSMVAMKAEATHTTPLFLGSIRLIPAGAVLLLWSKFFGSENRRKIPVVPQKAEDWIKIAAFAFVDGTCFQGFLAEGIQRTGAGLGSIIIDSQPISVAILASLFLNEEILPKTALGLGIGVLGLATLELPESIWTGGGATSLGSGLETLFHSVSIGHVGADLSSGGGGEVLMLLAAQSMAVGTILVRWVCKSIDPVVATGWHMILGGIPLLLVSLVSESDLSQRLQGLSAFDFLLLMYITLLGGAASYGIFFVNANKGNLTKLSSLTFLTPVFACVFGNLLLNETFSTSQIIGATVTLVGVLLVTVEFNQEAQEKKEIQK